MLQKLRAYMMPIAMILGLILHEKVLPFAFLIPYAISLMLFFTYCSIDFKSIRFTKMHYVLLAIQLLAGISVYLLLKPFSEVVAQGAMVLVVIPTAAAAAVVTNMLGGNLESITAYTILSNLVVAIVAPFYFTMVNESREIPIMKSVIDIGEHVFLLLFIPIVLAYLIYRFAPQLQIKMKKMKSFSFYLWVFTLIIAIGKTFSTMQSNDSKHEEVIGLILVALVICIGQFALGRYIGVRFGEKITGAQALGQKNTILGIWMAHSFLEFPIASLASGAYIIWQNIINSYQLWKKERMGVKR